VTGLQDNKTTGPQDYRTRGGSVAAAGSRGLVVGPGTFHCLSAALLPACSGFQTAWLAGAAGPSNSQLAHGANLARDSGCRLTGLKENLVETPDYCGSTPQAIRTMRDWVFHETVFHQHGMVHQSDREIKCSFSRKELFQTQPEEQHVRSRLSSDLEQEFHSAFSQRLRVGRIPSPLEHSAHNQGQCHGGTTRQTRKAMNQNGFARVGVGELKNPLDVLHPWWTRRNIFVNYLPIFTDYYVEPLCQGKEARPGHLWLPYRNHIPKAFIELQGFLQFRDRTGCEMSANFFDVHTAVDFSGFTYISDLLTIRVPVVLDVMGSMSIKR